MLTLALALALAQTPTHWLQRQPNLPRGAGYAFFEFAPTSGAGMPTACSTTAPTGAKGEALTFTRASVAECYSNDGQTLTQLAANQPRVSSGRIDSTWLGIWREPSIYNEILRSRDLANAAWTKTDASCVRNAAGMRGGDANGATTCTATADNATISQVVAKGPGIFSGSIHIKRASGTGAVSVSLDCANYIDITSRLSASRWRRVVSVETAGCAGGDCIIVPEMTGVGVSNPCIGVKLGTSGDAVVLDFAQLEWRETALALFSHMAPSSPMETAGTRALRQAESLTTVLATEALKPDNLCLAATVEGTMPGQTSYALYLTSNGAGTSLSTQAAWINAGSSALHGTVSCGYGGTNIGFLTQIVGQTVGARTLCDFTTSGITTALVGGTIPRYLSAGAPVGVVAGAKWLSIGGWPGSDITVNGVVKGVQVDVAGKCSTTTPVGAGGEWAWVGDSLIAGSASDTFNPPAVLTGRIGARVWNGGAGSSMISHCAATAANYSTTSGLVWTCGTNDMGSGPSGTALAVAAQVPLAAALARGQRVVVTGIVPRGSSAGWNASRETERNDFNNGMQAWAADAGATFVSVESMGEAITDGGCCVSLKAAFNSGDGLHLTEAGGIALADLVADSGVP